ncbi:MAG TPA: isoleucine--tRNA ligase [Armatimonadota bacterium]|nr:isoleucine--tRNA ligase [Armatimonadota bacterium]
MAEGHNGHRHSANGFQKTVNLPKTDFPMKANLPQRELDILRHWEAMDLYHSVQERTQGKPQYIVHDGPPFSNGDIHLGHALNKILKDIVVKFRSMQGFDAPFVPGWDTHGLPTEIKAIRSFHIDRYAIDPLELRRRCAETAQKFVEVQRKEFIRLGVRGDWDRPYLTMQAGYEAAVLDVFRHLVENNLVYRGLKPVYWCTTCETALAEAEIEYLEHESPSIYVAFPALTVPDTVFPDEHRDRMAAVIWTTTPWTLPANVAIAAHPDAVYALVVDDEDDERFSFIVARALVDDFAKAVKLHKPRVVGETTGRELAGAMFQHPFMERQVPIVLADYVTLESGTGLVHTAPGHGQEDFITGLTYGLPIIQPVGPEGLFGPEAGPFAGKVIYEAQEDILARMNRDGTLLAYDTILHQYPHCWRCRKPVIMRATQQWFIDTNRLKEHLLSAIDETNWVPEWGHERIANMVRERPDWCISRQRVWGTPIPVVYCTACDEPLLSVDIIAQTEDIFAREGANSWYQHAIEDFVPEGTACPNCGGTTFRKETDIFDVWFDSGSSHMAVLDRRKDLSWPASLYLEGHDQYRGWFQVSLITGVGIGRSAPYREVLTHGFILDRTGQKQSKSLGNIVDPQSVVEKFGADILRLWVSSADFRSDLVMAEDVFTQIIEAYRRIRNTIRFLLGNLFDFSPEMSLPVDQLGEIDRWALHRVNLLIQRVTDAYTHYEFHQVYRAISEFCTGDLSAFYLDVAKDWLYTALPSAPERRSTQTVFLHIAEILAQLLTPVLSFTAEEVWGMLPGEERAESIQLSDWPEVNPAWTDEPLAEKWGKILAVRSVVNAALDVARMNGVISQPLSAKVIIYSAGETELLLESLDTLSKIMIVSAAEVRPWEQRPQDAFVGAIPDVAVVVTPASGKQCPRCRIWRTTIGQNGAYKTICAECAATVGTLLSHG